MRLSKVKRASIISGVVVVLLILAGVTGLVIYSSEEDSAGMPEQSVIADTKEGEAYTLFAPLGSKTTYLIDSNGDYVHSWDSEYLPGPTSYLLETGNLLRSIQKGHPVFTVGGVGGGLELLDWDGKQMWEIPLVTEKSIQHHDIEVMPNGNILALLWDLKTRDEAIAAGMDVAIVPADGVWSERIIEIDIDTSEIVWQWDSWDHTVQNIDQSKPNFGEISDSGKINLNYFRFDKDMKGDWLHFNSVAYNSALDHIMVVPHLFNELWVIDHSGSTEDSRGDSGDILYRWGNPEAYGAGETSDKQLIGGHNAHWIDKNDADSSVLVFNNGNEQSGSSVIELLLPIQRDGREYTYTREATQPFEPNAPFWSFKLTPEQFFSPILSTAQRLPNGNTLILNGRSGVIFEITDASQIIWSYTIPGVNNLPVLTYSAERHYGSSQALKGKTLTSQGKITPIDGERSEAPAGSSDIQVAQ